MKFGGRVQAAIEVLDDILNRRTPVANALRDWGKSHRFAGSKDRSFIGLLVHDALRIRSSCTYFMGGETARALILGTLAQNWGENAASLSTKFKDDTHSPKPLSSAETDALSVTNTPAQAEDWIIVLGAVANHWLWLRI